MKKLLLLLCTFLCSVGTWADETSYVMTSYSSTNKVYTATDNQSGVWDLSTNCSSSNQLPANWSTTTANDRGICFSTPNNVTVTSQTSFENVTKIVVEASSNMGSRVTGTLAIKVGSTSLGSAQSLTKNNHNTYEFTSATPLSGKIILTVTQSANSVWIGGFKVTTSANVQKYNVNIANNIANGTVSANLTEAAAGATIELTATPSSGYKFDSWNVTNASTSEAITVTNNQFTMPAADVNVSASFAAIPKHTITWSVNGNTSTIAPTQVEDGTNITFPTGLADINGKKFVGWSANSAASSAGDIVSGDVTASANVTYYAVYATSEGASNLVKLNSGATFSDGDEIAVFAYDSESQKYYGMYQETVSTSYVSFITLDHEPTLADVSDDDKKTWTVNTVTGETTWYIGDDTNGYLYTSGSNNMAVVTDNKSKVTIAWNTTEDAFSMKIGSRWISSRSDLTDNDGANQYKFRLGGTGSTPLGTGYLNIYRIENNVVYRDYTTTIPTTATITLNAACTDGVLVYGTYSNSSAWVVSDDIEVSEVGVIDGELVVEHYAVGAIVPANTGVMVSALEGGDYSVNLSNETGTSVLGNKNCLHPSSEDMTGENLFYRLTMHNGTQVGFWWGAADGAAFQLAANKAYLAVPKSTPTAALRGFAFNGGEATAIKTVNTATSKAVYYNLNGQRVSANAKGIIVTNGKKHLVK